MTTISDQSSMALWPAWVWALGVALFIAGWFLVLGLARAADKPAPEVDEYEASPYGPVRKFRTDLCMVATCAGTKSVDLGNGWFVCADCAHALITGGDAA